MFICDMLQHPNRLNFSSIDIELTTASPCMIIEADQNYDNNLVYHKIQKSAHHDHSATLYFLNQLGTT